MLDCKFLPTWFFFLAVILFALILIPLFMGDASAYEQIIPLTDGSEAENEIIRIIKRVLDVIVGFIGAILDELADFVKEIMGFSPDEA